MRGRPNLYTSYEAETSILPTTTKRVFAAILIALLLLIPLQWVPGIRFLGDDDWLKLLSEVAIFAIGALGLNILTGLAGQVSLGHAFFFAVGAYTAAVFGGAEGGARIGWGLPIWIWLPAAGIVAAVAGLIVAPAAVRVRGLYLAFVTLGLVFIGNYLWLNLSDITGGSQVGRRFPKLELRLWKEEEPLVSFTEPGNWFGIELSGAAKAYLFLTLLALVFVVLSKNLQRTRTGRSFMAIRDRDIAAEVMGVAEANAKATAFALSSFYAGVCGALFGSLIGLLIPESFNLFLSVEFVAIVLIGGAGTVAGTLLGSAFVVLLPRLVSDFTLWLKAFVEEGSGLFAGLADVVVSTGPDDGGLVSTLAGTTPGLNVSQLNLVIYGLLIILFLIFEPLGLYGIWIRIRNYWKGWPFTY